MTEIHAHVVTTALVRKGFVKIGASHHTMFWLVSAGRRRGIRPRLSHGQGKVDDSLLSTRMHTGWRKPARGARVACLNGMLRGGCEYAESG